MTELDGPGAAEYIAEREGCAATDVKITPLAGGVSNHVLLIETPGRRYVIKQSLEKLRVKEDWFSRRDRIWREAEAIRVLGPMLPSGAVPGLLYEDRENYLFAMTVARGDRTWKSLLMAGEVDESHARCAAEIHCAMLQAPGAEAFGDQEVFDQLRLDPYYRFTATKHPDLREHFEAAIARCRTHRTALVHGDWSPKNMLVDGEQLTAIDFEVIHFGDPSFDAAFLLNHLLLKMFYLPEHAARIARVARVYWESVSRVADLTEGTLVHLPLLMLARVDGKSPAEYLRDEGLKGRVRNFARGLVGSGVRVMEVLKMAASATA
ncbi:MAG: phosphotransferase [Acidobacteria bacterium]|nr:phosphotransferase [Acidobacteriota bacterium]